MSNFFASPIEVKILLLVIISLFSISFVLCFIPPSLASLLLCRASKLVVEAASPVSLLLHRYFVVSSLLSRNYPSTSSSVLFSLKMATNKSLPYAEVLVYGGVPSDLNHKDYNGIFIPASKTCSHLIITAGTKMGDGGNVTE
uniref:Glyoxal oxidase N-terminal domain-containing protein n=1 Tax=Nelumbo nucifera TaxID=4432 RepID=A0A822XU63_NELNU|nr:TPA_asm: hypothetical protein HUJ06_024102 [Nelumbo nucifera]